MDRLSPTSGVVQDENLVYQQDGLQVMVAVDTPAWQSWLETATSFTFKCSEGNFTAHKTRASNGRGGWYWYAYRRQNGHLSNLYLGTSVKLTLRCLREAALALRSDERVVKSSTVPALASCPPDDPVAGADTLLVAKLHIPRLSAQHVSRARLLALLDQGVLGELTLVSAPAGSGKTTLLAEWAATSKCPVAWISLEATDNDPLRFIAYLVAALAGLDTLIDAAVRRYRPVDAQDAERALTGILNDLTHLLSQDAVVILDDYHLLTADAVHALLRFLLDHLPARLHLIIGTRVDPLLPLARLRARSQLSEVRAEALRFLSAEVEALAHVMGLALSEEATNLLEQRTEGWIAGVQLLALALRGQADATAFLRAFRGTHRFLLDYVSEEVLAQQTQETQRFLLRTSVLERMTGSLCDAVTGLPGGQARLADLLRANLFVSTLDDAETWYRYHPLFAEVLRAHLQKLEPELISELYLLACRWYEEHQCAEEACDYALLAGDLPRAAKLVEGLLPYLVEQGRFERLGHWLNQLPPDVIAASPQLYIATPWLYAWSRRLPENVEKMLDRMEQHVQRQQQNAPTSWVEPQSVLTLFHALLALSQNELPRAFTLVREALRILTVRETALSQLISRFLQIFLSFTYGASGDMATAEQILLDLSFTQPEESSSLINLLASFLLAELYKAQGQLRKVGLLYEDLSQTFGSQPALPPLPLLLLSIVLMRKAALLYEWNRLSEAEKLMQQVLETLQEAIQALSVHANRTSLSTFVLWAQARIELAQGRSEAARYLLDLVRNQPGTAEDFARRQERPPIDVQMCVTRLALACDQVEEAIRWESTCGIRFDDIPVGLLESRQVFAHLTLARVLIARGRVHRADEALSQALVLLDRWRDFAVHLSFQGWFIEIQMLTALALQARGKTRQALATLGPVLAQAESEGYVRLFADEGQPMAYLLAQISVHTTASHRYIQRLQDAISPVRQELLGPARSELSQLLPDPLSAREREVLSLLVAGASNQQIADHLVISLNTAKRHVKHILAKLVVTNRTQAVVRARELHLL